MSPVRLWPAALLIVSGCILPTGKCVYELRDIELTGAMTGSALTPGAPPAEVTVLLAESNDGPGYRTLSAYINTPAAGAISLVQLRQETPSGPETIFTFPLGSGQSGAWSVNVDLPRDRLPFVQLLYLGRLEKLSTFVQVGVQGNLGQLAGDLRVSEAIGWHHPYCD